MKKNRSPLKSKPLRNPGQSLDEQINDIRYGSFLESLLYVFVFSFLTIMEWNRFFFPSEPHPYIMTVVLLGVCVYAIPKGIKAYRKIQLLKLGRDGEKAVGQYLEKLRADGAEVLHDIVSGNFNLDHIVISEQGIFTIETKTYSKPNQGKAKITFRQGDLYQNGYNIGSRIIEQATSQSKWLKDLIKDLTGRDYDVKPVVVFPGWFVEIDNKQLKDLWIINPKGIGTFIKNQAACLTKEEKKSISYHLSRFVRNAPNN